MTDHYFAALTLLLALLAVWGWHRHTRLLYKELAARPSNCPSNMPLEAELWSAINRYTISVGGNPFGHHESAISRKQAITDVTFAISKIVVAAMKQTS